MKVFEVTGEGTINKEVKPEAKKSTRKTITKEEMDQIVDSLFEKIKKELDNTEYRIWNGMHKENIKSMEMLMERITDLEEKIK